MELPVTAAGRAEAAGEKRDLCVRLYIRNWILQERREDGYETLKENLGSRDITARGIPDQARNRISDSRTEQLCLAPHS